MHLLLYRVGAWCWIATGVGHLLGEAVLRLSPSPAGSTTDAVMSNHYFELLGTRRSIWQMMLGFGVTMGLAIVLAGVLFLLIARLAAEAPDRARAAGFAGLAASVILFALAVAVLPPPPIVTFALASLAFATALIFKPGDA